MPEDVLFDAMDGHVSPLVLYSQVVAADRGIQHVENTDAAMVVAATGSVREPSVDIPPPIRDAVSVLPVGSVVPKKKRAKPSHIFIVTFPCVRDFDRNVFL